MLLIIFPTNPAIEGFFGLMSGHFFWFSKAKQNKEMLLERAARFTHWFPGRDLIPAVLHSGPNFCHRLEEHSCQVAIVVGATQTVCPNAFSMTMLHSAI